MSRKMQTKLLSLQAVEFKFDGDKGVIEGYASTFGGKPDSYGDVIAPGAFKNTLVDRERPIRMRWNHFGPVIGKWTSIEEDERGLKVRGELTPGHSVAADVYASLKHGAIDGLSIGYYTLAEEKQGDVTLLKEIELVEISVVEEPANVDARIGEVKAALETIDTPKEAEALLRDAVGVSKSLAAMFVSRVYGMGRRDAEAAAKAGATLAALERFKLN